MNILRRTLMTAVIVYLSAAAAHAAPQSAAERATFEHAKFEKDRQSILAMAGEFKVTFDMRETVSFLPDYTPISAKVSGGHEVVRVIEDTGTHIVLQHLLVADMHGTPLVIKHWRQDWTYEPDEILNYTAMNHWTVQAVPAALRKGTWSQTVWQTDDSPRYGGVGMWDYSDGVARWTSDATWRPLARRDATRHPPYDHYIGTNRHAITPAGWVHEQDNAKIGPHNGTMTTYTHEVVLNTYARTTDAPALDAAADSYWTKTRDYWAQVRSIWDRAIARGHGIAVTEDAENGSVTGPKLMGLADDIATGKVDTAGAVAQAQQVIAGTSVAALH